MKFYFSKAKKNNNKKFWGFWNNILKREIKKKGNNFYKRDESRLISLEFEYYIIK